MRSIALPRTNNILLFGLLAVAALYVGRLFLMPLAFAALLAMLLRPVSNWLEGRGLGRAWAALLCLLLVLAFVAGMGWIVGAQGANIAEEWPQLKGRLFQQLEQIQQEVLERFGIAPERQTAVLRQQLSRLSDAMGTVVRTTLKGVLGVVGGLVLVLLYLFFLLWQRAKFRTFALQLAEPDNRSEAANMLDQISKVGGQYLIGRLVSMVFLAVFYAVGFSIIGLKNAVLLGLIGVLPTIVPYVGAYVGAAFPLAMALASGDSGTVLPTVGVIVAAQFLDNNIIEPLAMGSALHLNPFFTIIAVVLGELLWGIPGMILFEPLFAVVRIGCRHVPALRPYADLLGDDDLPEPGWLQKAKQLFKRKS